MEVLEEGHIYSLNALDCNGTETLCFVNRNKGNKHPGTNNQEVLRALINRVQFLNKQIPWRGNEEIISHLRKALVLHESRHIERLVDRRLMNPENVPTGKDGHFILKYGDNE